jgi:hypothetical protein
MSSIVVTGFVVIALWAYLIIALVPVQCFVVYPFSPNKVRLTANKRYVGASFGGSMLHMISKVNYAPTPEEYHAPRCITPGSTIEVCGSLPRSTHYFLIRFLFLSCCSGYLTRRLISALCFTLHLIVTRLQ